MHPVALPGTLIDSAIRPGVYSLPMDVIVVEFSNISRIVVPLEISETMLFSVLKMPLVLGSIIPELNSIPMLTVL